MTAAAHLCSPSPTRVSRATCPSRQSSWRLCLKVWTRLTLASSPPGSSAWAWVSLWPAYPPLPRAGGLIRRPGTCGALRAAGASRPPPSRARALSARTRAWGLLAAVECVELTFLAPSSSPVLSSGRAGSRPVTSCFQANRTRIRKKNRKLGPERGQDTRWEGERGHSHGGDPQPW